MTLKEAREIVKNYRKPTFYDHQIVLILDNRITELETQLKEIMDWYDKDDRLGDTSELFEKARELLEE